MAAVRGPTLASMYYSARGFVYYQQGDFDQALSAFDQAIALRPDFEQAYVNRATAYNMLGK